MMKNLLFGITILAFLLHFAPASAKAGESLAVDNQHPISGLIADWHQFRAQLLSKTHQFDRVDLIHDGDLSRLPERLIGGWEGNQQEPGGYQLQTVLRLQRDHRFSYDYRISSGARQERWTFSGRWELRNQILMLLIDRSNYPGKQVHQVLFWRLLRLADSKLVYVRTGSKKLSALTRLTG
jgi:hypothetical protein